MRRSAHKDREGARLARAEHRYSSLRAASSGSGSSGARIHTSCAVVSAPTLDRAPARWCLTVECDRPSRCEAAFSDPATRTVPTTSTSRTVARPAWRERRRVMRSGATRRAPAARRGASQDGRWSRGNASRPDQSYALFPSVGTGSSCADVEPHCSPKSLAPATSTPLFRLPSSRSRWSSEVATPHPRAPRAP